MSKAKSNIVDKNDNVIGIEDRDVIHEQGMLHREIHVYFVTPNNEIIFQHRAKDKDTYPDLLDATVGGHVEIGDSYEATAIKEVFEETGLMILETDLIPLAKLKIEFYDAVTGKTNHAFQSEYVYLFNGDVKDLKIEDGKAIGFEVWPIGELLGLGEGDKAKFIPFCYSFAVGELKDYIKSKGAKI